MPNPEKSVLCLHGAGTAQRAVPTHSGFEMKSTHCTISTLALLALTFTQGLAQTTYEPNTFTTLAGGTCFNGSATPGNAARLSNPAGLAVYSTGNVYVA